MLRDYILCATKVLLLLWSRVLKKIRMSLSDNARNNRSCEHMYFMEDFVEGSWFANLQNPTCEIIEAEDPQTHHTFSPKRDDHRFIFGSSDEKEPPTCDMCLDVFPNK